MSFNTTTYVIFDGDKDMWAYRFMRGWNVSEHVDFHFEDAHELNVLTNRAEDEAYVKSRLRERFRRTDQVIVLIGESTKCLYKFVRWELEVALELGLPIIAVNLNNKRSHDEERCPAILDGKYVVHVPFKAKIIKYAMEHFPGEHSRRSADTGGNRHYGERIYAALGL